MPTTVEWGTIMSESKKKSPLDEFFNFAEPEPMTLPAIHPHTNTDVLEVSEPDGYLAPPEATITQKYEDDAEDKEISKKIDTVYDEALNAYHEQSSYIDELEPRYAARNAEVAATFLNTALNAVALKARVKGEKRKSVQAFIPYANNSTTNNVVVSSPSQLLEMMRQNKEDGNK